MDLQDLFIKNIQLNDNLILFKSQSEFENQEQTNATFSDKWGKVNQYEDKDKFYEFQYGWFLSLYGFESEENLKSYLSDKEVILDAGCGLGYKTEWFARLAPHAVVIGIDYSDAAIIAARNYAGISNLYFVKGDIADTGLITESIDFVLCDQVIMHTQFPKETFKHLTSITKKGGEFLCYVYAKKALPRELLDDYFRTATKAINSEELWEMSRQLTLLGKQLSDLNVTLDFPEIPLLGIKGGKQDLQRFIYWNFIKCFWKEDYGYELNDSINYDWYSPSNAKRYSEEEYRNLIEENNLKIIYFHREPACYSGRFKKE